MEQVDAVAQIVAPWLAATDRLEQSLADRAASLSGLTATAPLRQSTDRLRATLQALARCEQAIPAETAVEWQRPGGQTPVRIDQLLHIQPHRELPPGCPASANELRLRRDAVLRLSVWQRLVNLRDQALLEHWADGAFAELQRRIAHGVGVLPPGIGPSLKYAGSPAAQVFFDRKLRPALHKLAALHNAAHAGFTALAALAAYDDSGLAVQRWSGAWTAAVAGVYLDWLHRHSDGNLTQAIANLGSVGAGTVRFRALSELMVLPSRERDMHLDLWTNLVHAQVLCHDASRWQRAVAGDAWHRVKLAMHDLAGKERRLHQGAGVRTFVRGLGVEMIYQVVFIDCAGDVLSDSGSAEMPVPQVPPPLTTQTFVVELPAPCGGQQFNMQLAICWQQRSQERRFLAHASELDGPLKLSEAQHSVIAGWSLQRPASKGESHALPPALVDWCAATSRHRFEDESGAPWVGLGHARLWAAAGEDAQWLELELAVWSGGRCQAVPLCVHDELIDGELRSWLLVEAQPVPGIDAAALHAALADRAANFWAVNHAGLGAFVYCAIDLNRVGSPSPRRP